MLLLICGGFLVEAIVLDTKYRFIELSCPCRLIVQLKYLCDNLCTGKITRSQEALSSLDVPIVSTTHDVSQYTA